MYLSVVLVLNETECESEWVAVLGRRKGENYMRKLLSEGDHLFIYFLLSFYIYM